MTTAVFFDIPHAYYVPQYAPLIAVLQKRGIICHGVLHRGNDSNIKEIAADDCALHIHWCDDPTGARKIYQQHQAEWIIFGNSFAELDQLPEGSKTALLYHGLDASIKSATQSSSLSHFDVRFVYAPSRMPLFASQSQSQLHCVGFAKLDPLHNPKHLQEQKLDLQAIGLDSNKPTLLYAPTFYPSSIEKMSRTFPEDFADYNILIKAHDFSLHKSKYKKQRQKLQHWNNYPNVYLAQGHEYSLLPFMATADLLLSDTSSAIFEFASLNKPVVICNFIHVRWNYRGPFSYKLKKRLDSSTLANQALAARVDSYRQLKTTVEQHLSQPELLEAERQNICQQILGKMDGQAAVRMANIILSA